MTNWMTAAGLAFIAGGLATLISFRAMIFGGGARRATRAGASARRRRSRSLPGPALMETGPTLADSVLVEARADSVPVPAPTDSVPVPVGTGPPAATDLREPYQARPTVPSLLEAGPAMVDAESSPGDCLEPIEPEPQPEPGPARRSARSRVGRRRRLAAVFSGRPTDTDPGHSGLASIGLADDESPFEPASAFDHAEQGFDQAEQGFHRADQGFDHAEQAGAFEFAEPASAFDLAEPVSAFDLAEPESAHQLAESTPASEFADSAPAFHPVAAGDENPGYADSGRIRDYGPEPADNRFAEAAPMPEPRPAVDRSDRSYGDRIDGWVRPHYPDLDDRPPAGDYWTPVPDDLYADPEPSARGYGWPVPVERLPPVPDYEPATGFDLTPVESAEPTALVPAWPPAAEDRRIRLPRSWANRDEKASGDEQNAGRRARRAATDDRPRPRPRPAARVEPGSAYVSRHSAGPHG